MIRLFQNNNPWTMKKNWYNDKNRLNNKCYLDDHNYSPVDYSDNIDDLTKPKMRKSSKPKVQRPWQIYLNHSLTDTTDCING